MYSHAQIAALGVAVTALERRKSRACSYAYAGRISFDTAQRITDRIFLLRDKLRNDLLSSIA